MCAAPSARHPHARSRCAGLTRASRACGQYGGGVTNRYGTMAIGNATTIANNSAEVRRALDPPPPTRVTLRGSDTSVAGERGRTAAA